MLKAKLKLENNKNVNVKEVMWCHSYVSGF